MLKEEAIIFRNQEGLTLEEVKSYFRSKVAESSFKDEAEQLAETFSKHPTDRFVIYEKPTCLVNQGDINIWAEGTRMYNQEFPRIEDLTETENMVLQESDSLTGDHRIVTLTNAEISVMEGTFIPSFLEDNEKVGIATRMRAIIIESKKPFLIFHREHGNIVLPAGKYMASSQINQEDLRIMRD